jgi:UDP-2-acetamido-3-amino-2,3-dideoxy-glucuronate N-acetyltransferase
MVAAKISPNASVSNQASLSNSVSIWDFSQVRENAKIGENSIIGSYVYIDANVKIGKNCKIQNRALLYDPAILHDGVFIGPGAILTNDKNPRSVSPANELKSSEDWKKVGVEVFEGASIGSGAICIAPIKIGKWATIGAGAVVTKDVPNHALMVGNPARQIGWVGKSGLKLVTADNKNFKCPILGTTFQVIDGSLVEN